MPAARANTAISWGGQPWIMVIEPLPSDAAERASLLFHEAWHVHQDVLGYPSNNAVAAHLDDPVARYLIRLEWAALEQALSSHGASQHRHIAQALAFRKRRLAKRPEAAEAERQQMRHEGVAAYTGTALSGEPERLALAVLRSGAERAALGRSFAYVSGPAWGLLLDRHAPGWRRSGEKADLPDMLPVAPAEIARPDAYGGTEILSDETLAGFERARRIREAMEATSEFRGLRLPLEQIRMDFDPDRVSTGPDGSTIYHKITLGDRWGRVQLEGIGVRVLSDFTAAFAPWPLPDGALNLAPGWRVEERAKGGAAVVPIG